MVTIMDAGLAAIVAASVSTVLGGALGFVSAYLTSRQSHCQARYLASLPRQAKAVEFVFLIVFKSLAGEQQSQNVWDQYITNCLWLPPKERNICLDVLKSKGNPQALVRAQEAILGLMNAMVEEE